MAPSDAELIALVMAGGDQRAFATLVNRHQQAVRGLLMRLCRNCPSSEHLAQLAA